MGGRKGARENKDKREWRCIWKWESHRGSFSWASRKEFHWSWENSLKFYPGKLLTAGLPNQRIWKNRANGPQGTHSSPVSFKAAAPIGLRANSSLQSTDWFSSHSNGHSAYKEASVCDQQSHPVKTGRMNRCSWLRGPWYTTPDPARSPLLPEN